MPGDAPISILIVFKDGHEERFAMSDIASGQWSATRHASVGTMAGTMAYAKSATIRRSGLLRPGTFSDKPDNVTSARKLEP
jgi:hypothetical protein